MVSGRRGSSASGGGSGGGGGGVHEQEKWLHSALQSVKSHSFHMKAALDANALGEALRHASVMLSELRTALLSPGRYYSLFLACCDELRHLSAYVSTLPAGVASYGALYERTQHCGNVVPRLYLLVTVGGNFIASKEAGSKDVLRDLVEMCKGVQHPAKGLFLRSYLLQTARDKLPDVGSPYESGEAGVADAVHFLLDNFAEMNKLWVRMRYQGAAEDAMRREKERGELRELVGKNLTLLSELEGLDVKMYANDVLPKLVEQVLACKDDLAQAYVMDVIVQRFPDEYHKETFPAFLAACKELQPSVDVTRCVSPLLERLAEDYKQAAESGASDVGGEPKEGDTFSSLLTCITEISESREDMPHDKVCDMFGAMMAYAVAVHGASSLAHVDAVLNACHGALTKRLTGGVMKDRKGVEALSRMLKKPLQLADNPVDAIMNLSGLSKLVVLLGGMARRENALVVLRRCVEMGVPIANEEALSKLLSYCDVLLHDMDGSPDLDEEDFAEDQEVVARVVHLLQVDATTPPKEAFAMISTAHAAFSKGGSRRMRYTLVPLAFAALRLARRLRILAYPQKQGDDGEPVASPGADKGKVGGVSTKKVFGLLHEMASAFWEKCSDQNGAPLALKTFLCAGESALLSGLGAIGEEFLTKAFEVYEESISESQAQYNALALITAALQHVRLGLEKDSLEALLHKATSCSSSLLKKRDQCLAVLRASHLFWQDDVTDPRVVELEAAVASASADQKAEYEGRSVPPITMHATKDGERVMQCLKRALKSAKAAEQQLAGRGGSSSDLYLAALQEYMYFYGKGVSTVNASDVTALVELVAGEENITASARERTFAHIKNLQASGEAAERWAAVAVP